MSTDPLTSPDPEPPAPPRGSTRRRIGTAAAASVLVVGLVAGGAAAVGMRSGSGDPDNGVYRSPTTTTEQLPFTGSQRRFGSSYPGTPPDAGPPSPTQPEGSQGSTSDETATASAAQSAGVVEISSTLTSGKAAGTGMVLRADGIVVTNHHVVAAATSIEVTVPATGETYTARYLGGDAAKDIALLRLNDAANLTTVDLSSDGVDVGDEVTSVGDANGDGGSLTAAPGTVTAENQSITVDGDDGAATRLTGLIELDADLVPGDSGGAVLDADGDVVAMNVAASTGAADVTGYAIPIETVNEVVAAILAGDESGSVEVGYHGYLGVGLDPSSTTPLVVSTVDGGPADDAGITAGDTITAVGETAIRTADQLRDLLAGLDPGDSAEISWTTSGGTTRSATVTLGRAPIS